jgi:hypothetical protein
MGDVVKRPEIGDRIYRKVLHSDRQDYWYEGYPVVKVTEKRVYFRHPFAGTEHFIKRRVLEHLGYATHNGLGVFVIEMPEEYRRRTMGFIMDQEPRKILGLKDKFTPEELEAAYRRQARVCHPDAGGTEEAFRNVNKAYEHLKDDNVAETMAKLSKNPQD